MRPNMTLEQWAKHDQKKFGTASGPVNRCKLCGEKCKKQKQSPGGLCPSCFKRYALEQTT